MKLSDKNVDLFYSLIDKACMVYYNDIKLDYLDAFKRVSSDITKEYNFDKLQKKSINMLEKVYERIQDLDLINEEARLALELILIKGFKHRNLSLDFLTPDFINYLFSYIVRAIVSYNVNYSDKEIITILDTVLGTSNLLQTIINNVDIDVCGIGIEKDEFLVGISIALNDLLDNQLVVNCNDATLDNLSYCDICIGDFGDDLAIEKKSIYTIIEKRLDNISDNGYFVYLINNDFFNNMPSNFHNTITSVATLVGLIVLPSTFTTNNHVGKSILIGKKEVMNNYQMSIIKIDEDLSQENLQKTIDKINNIFKKIGG